MKLTSKEAKTMKKLNITKEQFEKSRYFKNKYGTLEYVSESGKVFKTNKGQVLTFVKEGVNGPGSKDRDPNPQPEDWDWVHDRVAKKLTRKIARELGSKFRNAAARDDADYIAIGFAGSIYDSPKAKAIIEKVKNMYPEQLVFSGISTLNRGKGEVTFEVNKEYVFDLVGSKPAMESTKESGRKFIKESSWDNEKFEKQIDNILHIYSITRNKGDALRDLFKVIDDVYAQGYADGKRDSVNESRKPRFVKESYHGRVEVEASILATGRTAEEALELLHNRILDADAKIVDENGNPNPEIVDKYNYWFDENEGDVDFDICRDNNSNGFIQMGIKAI